MTEIHSAASSSNAVSAAGRHVPVMLLPALEALDVQADGVYVDGTFGRGGHAAAVMEKLGADGRLVAFDKDPQALATAAERFGQEPRFEIVHASFAELRAQLEQRGLLGRVQGLLLDLGVSSPQLDDAERGFSFMADGPLDMRMDCRDGANALPTAADFLATAEREEISRVLKDLGEERWHWRIAGAIVEARAEQPLSTTQDLVAVIDRAVPRGQREKHKHPATRSFLALRLHVNRELADLEEGLEAALDALAPGGRLVVISFHSLEDRITKRFIKTQARPPQMGRPDLPLVDEVKPRLRELSKAIKPSAEEVAMNPRARSAVMRVAERLEYE